MGYLSAVRVTKIKSISQMQGISLHALRQDKTSRKRLREGAEAGTCFSWSKASNQALDGIAVDPRDLLTAYKEHKKETGAGERKGAPLALHMLCIVSPEWVKGAGNLHDKENPRNKALMDGAKMWADSWAGKGSVIAARLDLDEVGGAVVDLIISPVRMSRGKSQISTSKALKELKETTGERNEYAALQTSWANFAAQKLSSKIKRGTSKSITKRKNVDPETYGILKDQARAEALAELKAHHEHFELEKIAFIKAKEEAEQVFEKATNLREAIEVVNREKQKNIREVQRERLTSGGAIIAARRAHDKALENISKERNRIIQFALKLSEACSDVINLSQEFRQHALIIAKACGERLQKEWQWFREIVLQQIRDEFLYDIEMCGSFGQDQKEEVETCLTQAEKLPEEATKAIHKLEMVSEHYEIKDETYDWNSPSM